MQWTGRKSTKTSHEFRKKNSEVYVKLGDKFGGYKKGVPNGPAPSTPRGKRRGKSQA